MVVWRYSFDGCIIEFIKIQSLNEGGIMKKSHQTSVNAKTYLLLTIFLGWIGGHRFYRKQFALGILYLLTGGLFCIGWIVDIGIAISKYNQGKKAINNMQSFQSNSNILTDELQQAIDDARRLGTDLLEADYPQPADAKTATYRGRIYSITGSDTRFPILPHDIGETDLIFYPFVFGVSKPSYCRPGQEIVFSNRPFMDERSQQEIAEHNTMVNDFLQAEKNRADFAWIQINLPILAPKSLSGYVRMKKSNSDNFKKLKEAAKEKGYEI